MDGTPTTSQTPVTEPAFLRRLAELENAVELSRALANQAEQLELRYLGARADDQNQGGPAHVPTSLNDALEVHAINLKIALERISYALVRLDDESSGIPLSQDPVPVVDPPFRSTVPLQELGVDYKGPPY